MQITIGDIGAISGVLIYRPEFSGHKYRKPHIIALGYIVFAIAVAMYLWTSMTRANARRDRLLEKTEREEGKDTVVGTDADESWRQGDRHVRWRYQV